MQFISLRGAVTADENSVEAIDEAALVLMETLIEVNNLEEDQVVNVLFSATADLTARYPSVVVRNVLGWHQTAMLNLEEKVIDGQLPRCIRVLMLVQTQQPREAFKHIYLRKAARLRPDWTGDQ